MSAVILRDIDRDNRAKIAEREFAAFFAGLTFGYITTDAQLFELVRIDRLRPVLIRCGGCRLTTAAQCVPHVMKCIKAGGDYVRDISVEGGAQ